MTENAIDDIIQSTNANFIPERMLLDAKYPDINPLPNACTIVEW